MYDVFARALAQRTHRIRFVARIKACVSSRILARVSIAVLTPQPQFADQRLITRFVFVFEVVEELAPMRYHLQETAP